MLARVPPTRRLRRWPSGSRPRPPGPWPSCNGRPSCWAWSATGAIGSIALAELLIEGRRRQNLRAILFTSCHRAEGRTTLVLTLARALARHPCRTVLVDADLTGPMLARLLGLRPEVGLDDVVEGGQALSDALIDAPDDHLTVLPIRSAVARPRDFLAAPAWTCALGPAPPRVRPDPARRRPAVHRARAPRCSTARSTPPCSSTTAGLTGERAILRAREVLEAGGVPLLGLAETFV